MHKRLNILINNIQELFLNRLGKKTGFIKRRSKITAETFLSFNTFSSNDMCDKSLSTLCGRLAAQHNISISPQALNERFNQRSVNFMQKASNIIMMKQNKILNCENSKLNFNKILVNDATSYKLSEKFCNKFKESGGSSSKSAIKIQLQYDLLSGKFICCDTYNGTSSDGKYVDVMDNHTKA